jgi:hypothetical protein
VALAAACSFAGAAEAQGLDARLWWNDPEVVERLALTSEQRAKMDALLAKQPASRNANEHALAFQRALEQGNSEAARRALAAWADASRDEIRARGELKIEVLALLTKSQREKVAALQPGVLGRPWTPRRSWTKQPDPVVIQEPGAPPRIVQPGEPTAPPSPGGSPPAPKGP